MAFATSSCICGVSGLISAALRIHFFPAGREVLAITARTADTGNGRDCLRHNLIDVLGFGRVLDHRVEFATRFRHPNFPRLASARRAPGRNVDTGRLGRLPPRQQPAGRAGRSPAQSPHRRPRAFAGFLVCFPRLCSSGHHAAANKTCLRASFRGCWAAAVAWAPESRRPMAQRFSVGFAWACITWGLRATFRQLSWPLRRKRRLSISPPARKNGRPDERPQYRKSNCPPTRSAPAATSTSHTSRISPTG